MNQTTFPFPAAVLQLQQLYSVLQEQTGTSDNGMTVAVPALETIRTLFKRAMLQSQANLPLAGTCCTQLSEIQNLLIKSADQENAKQLSRQIIEIKCYVTSACFMSVNYDMKSSLNVMRENCQIISERISRRIEEYSAHEKTADTALQATLEIDELLKDFKRAVLGYSEKATKIWDSLPLMELEARCVKPGVLQEFNDIMGEIKKEFETIHKSIRALKDQFAPLFPLVTAATVTSHIAVGDIVDKANPFEAFQNHAKMLFGCSVQLEKILAGERTSPAQFLSLCGDMYEHINATNDRLRRLHSSLHKQTEGIQAIRDAHFRDIQQNTADLVSDPNCIKNGVVDQAYIQKYLAFLKQSTENYGNALLQYNKYAALVKACDDLVDSTSFIRPAEVYLKARTTDGYPHFDSAGNFVEPFTFDSDNWLVDTLKLRNFTEFKNFQDTMLYLEQRIGKLYTKLVGTPTKLVARYPFLQLQMYVKDWGHC